MAYYRPKSIKEALEILAKEGSSLMPIAGCTDVGVAKQDKTLKKHEFIDLSYLNEMKFIREEGEYILIGALATHAEIAASELIKSKAPILAEACSTVGSPQIRNRGTVGGNVNHASPSGDSIPALYVLDAEFLLESAEGQQWIPAVKYFTGPGKTVRQENELLTTIRFKPLKESYRVKFIKLGQRKALACSKISIAFVARLDNGKISDVRIAMGAVAPTVIRTPKTEEFLNGKELTPDIIESASKLICSEVSPITDLRSSEKYRRQMAGVLLKKAIYQCGLMN